MKNINSKKEVLCNINEYLDINMLFELRELVVRETYSLTRQLSLPLSSNAGYSFNLNRNSTVKYLARLNAIDNALDMAILNHQEKLATNQL
jgi:hypothetical protein